MYDIQLTSHHVKAIFKQIELTIYLDFRKVVAQSCLAKNVFLKIRKIHKKQLWCKSLFFDKKTPTKVFFQWILQNS